MIDEKWAEFWQTAPFMAMEAVNKEMLDLEKGDPSPFSWPSIGSPDFVPVVACPHKGAEIVGFKARRGIPRPSCPQCGDEGVVEYMTDGDCTCWGMQASCKCGNNFYTQK